MITKEQIKENYSGYSDYLLEQVVRMNRTKAAGIDRQLADGTAAKHFRHSADLTESLRQVADINAERWAVAAACEELLSERR